MRYRIKDPDERRGLKLLGMLTEFTEEDIADRHSSYYFYGDQRDCIYLDFFAEFEIEPVEDAPAEFRFKNASGKDEKCSRP